MIPLWGVGGLAWGVAMLFLMGGDPFGWLIGGILWGASVWFVFSLFMLVAYRERSTSIPLQDEATLAERLAGAMKRLGYSVEQESPTHFVCKPKHGLARVLAL